MNDIHIPKYDRMGPQSVYDQFRRQDEQKHQERTNFTESQLGYNPAQKILEMAGILGGAANPLYNRGAGIGFIPGLPFLEQ